LLGADCVIVVGLHGTYTMLHRGNEDHPTNTPTMSYNRDLPTPEAEIDKDLDFHNEDVKHTLPVGDGYVDDPSKGHVQTVRNVCSLIFSYSRSVQKYLG